jgi:CubicO group peptidase (beta-lactamase class C family)
MGRRSFARALLLPLFCAGGAIAQPLPKLGGTEVSAFAYASAGRSGTIASHAEGGAELSPDGRIVRPMAADTPVRIASVSKLFVALAIHRLADAGRLSLDDDASRHLGWQLRNPAFPDAPITIRMLLRHMSGLSDAGGYSFALGSRLSSSLTAKNWNASAPGAAFDYANIGFPVLAGVIEAISGQRFDRAMRTLVFEPLEIDACFNWSGCTDSTTARGAVLYRKAPSSDGPWDPAGPWYPQVDAVRPAPCPVRADAAGRCDLADYQPGTQGGLFSPQGGLRISVVDLVRAGQMLLNNDGRFLKPASIDALFDAQPVNATGKGEETDSGLMRSWSSGGLHCLTGAGKAGTDQPLAPAESRMCGHLGEAYGLRSALQIDRRAGRVIAYAFTGTAEVPPRGLRSRFSAAEEELFARASR